MITERNEWVNLLVQAEDYARAMGASPWDFAVEVQVLRRAGVTNSDLRWLLSSNYLNHRVETTSRADLRRSFREQGPIFSRRSCFVLTSDGYGHLKSLPYAEHADGPASMSARPPGLASVSSEPAALLAAPALAGTPQPGTSLAATALAIPATSAGSFTPHEMRPQWDPDRREIRVGDRLVKRFRLPSPNQETILVAFEEEGWPRHIDDPLPPGPDGDPKQRLRDTIRSLNRHQKRRLLRFMGNGTGKGVVWEFVGDLQTQSS